MKRTISFFIIIAAMTAFFACSQSKSAARDKLELMDIPFDDTEYMNSLKRGDTLVARLFVLAGKDPNMKDEHGSTPLIFASIRGNTDLIETLLKKGADPNMVNNASATPLMIAASMGRKDAVQMFVDKKVEVNAQDVSGETALAYASSRGFLPVVNILLESGADPNIGNKAGQTPLIKAAVKNRADIAEVLLANGAEMRHRDNTGLDAATYAKRHEFSEPFIEVLSKHHHSTKDSLTAKPVQQ